MKTLQIFTTIGLLTVIFIGIMAFKSPPTSKNYQHLFIVAEHYDLDRIYISIDGKEYKKMNFAKQRRGAWDLNPIINLIDQYENDGWELVECNTNNILHTYRLRKE